MNILLTGAGFSRNWGGMLAKDVFSHLLGDDQLDQTTRDLLIRAHTTNGSFEDVLAALQLATDGESKKRYDALIAALVGLFNLMGQSFMQRDLEFKNPPDTRYWLRGFLQRFPFIFTLNQDTLLELNYLSFVGPQPFGRAHIPGMKYLNPSAMTGSAYDRIAIMEPNLSDFQLQGGVQHYIKLHGSCNWVESSSGGRILIMGGQKSVSIGRFPVLAFYHDQFRELVRRPGAKLMVIGYSFSDEHINEVILDAVLTHGLGLFIVDPGGLSIFDKRDPSAAITPPPGPLMDLIPRLKGISDRPLSSTFGDDHFEWSKLSKFLE
jgi:SIR2-like domain